MAGTMVEYNNRVATDNAYIPEYKFSPVISLSVFLDIKLTRKYLAVLTQAQVRGLYGKVKKDRMYHWQSVLHFYFW